MIARHNDLIEALIYVARKEIDSHPGDYRRAPGYSWHSGGVVPQRTQELLDEAGARHLVSLIPAMLPDGSRGAVLRLSVAGERALSGQDSQIPPASGPTRHPNGSGVGVLPGAGATNREGEW